MILEAKTSISMTRANVGVLFTLTNERGEKLGDVLIEWAKVPQMIDKLTEWQTEAKPKHYVLTCNPAAIGAALGV